MNKIEHQSEDQLQAECFKWIWNNYPQTRRCIFAIPNGGKRSPTEAMKLRATGVVPGVQDKMLLWRGIPYFFELKVGHNRLSKKQIEFCKAITEQGAYCYEIRSLEQFQQIINDILDGCIGSAIVIKKAEAIIALNALQHKSDGIACKHNVDILRSKFQKVFDRPADATV